MNRFMQMVATEIIFNSTFIAGTVNAIANSCVLRSITVCVLHKCRCLVLGSTVALNAPCDQFRITLQISQTCDDANTQHLCSGWIGGWDRNWKTPKTNQPNTLMFGLEYLVAIVVGGGCILVNGCVRLA